jgi:predicted PurR-regulated permease PerM
MRTELGNPADLGYATNFVTTSIAVVLALCLGRFWGVTAASLIWLIGLAIQYALAGNFAQTDKAINFMTVTFAVALSLVTGGVWGVLIAAPTMWVFHVMIRRSGREAD